MLDAGNDMCTPGKGVAGMKEFEFNRAIVEEMVKLLGRYENTEIVIIEMFLVK